MEEDFSDDLSREQSLPAWMLPITEKDKRKYTGESEPAEVSSETSSSPEHSSERSRLPLQLPSPSDLDKVSRLRRRYHLKRQSSINARRGASFSTPYGGEVSRVRASSSADPDPVGADLLALRGFLPQPEQEEQTADFLLQVASAPSVSSLLGSRKPDPDDEPDRTDLANRVRGELLDIVMGTPPSPAPVAPHGAPAAV